MADKMLKIELKKSLISAALSRSLPLRPWA